MNLEFDNSFSKSIDKLKNTLVKKRLLKLIEQCEAATDISKIPGIKKMEGFKSFYRLRIGDYRVGFELTDNNTILFIIVAHRKDIYRMFP